MNDTQRFQRIAELFESARHLSPPDRDSFLADHCQGDSALLDEVHRLLRHHKTEASPLDTPIVSDVHHTEVLQSLGPARVPASIGRFQIIKQIGIGGMGVVYLAEQEHPKREVAVKVIRPGVLGRELIQRFEYEAETLGRLQHPGIAQIFEAGTFEDGSGPRPYFAMELIEGVSLVEFAKRHELSIRDRLLLFIQICEALHHAHQRGTIHRDIKPSNILVDPSGQPKVLDFGVACAASSDRRLTVLQTDAGPLIGTLTYMSPEQMNRGPDEIDTRSDVYSLGVTLYELLSGELPFEVSNTTFVAAARLIAETDPIPLSTRSKNIHADLNTIVLMALEKDPARRYQSASDLAADIRRYLQHEPIVARPATTMYCFRRYARRHVGLMAGLTIACLAVIGGVTGIAWKASQLQTESTSRQEVATFLRDMLTSIEPEKSAGDVPTVRMLLDDASGRLEHRFQGTQMVGADLHETIGQTYHKIGSYKEAESHLRAALQTYRQQLGFSDEQTIQAAAALAYTLIELDRIEEAGELLADTAQHLDNKLTDGARSIQVKQAIVYDMLGRETEAEEMYRSLYERTSEHYGDSHVDTLNALLNLGTQLMEQGRFDEACLHLETACSGLRSVLGNDYPDTLMAIANLGAVYCNSGRHDEGVALIAEAAERSERVLGPLHLHTIRRRQNLSVMHWQLGSQSKALALTQKLLEDCQTELGSSHSETIRSLELDTSFLALTGDRDAAEKQALDWYKNVVSELGGNHRSAKRVAILLANLYEEWGEAEQYGHWLSNSR
jgi:serine/threonine protein kinase/tetratricopeptide (TPR) repeat protein